MMEIEAMIDNELEECHFVGYDEEHFEYLVLAGGQIRRVRLVRRLHRL